MNNNNPNSIYFNKKTKIVCTIGPSSWDKDTLIALAQAGMDITRLNFSHGSHEEKGEQIKLIREVSQIVGKPLVIVADLQGPKIRLGKFEGVRQVVKDETITLSIHTSGNEDEIKNGNLPMVFDLSPFVEVGQRIYLNDGLVEIVVSEVSDQKITGIVKNNGWVSSNKGVNIPDTTLKGVVFTEKDRQDAEFALSQKVDYLALSFIQTVEDLNPVKDMINAANSETKIIVKVEKNEAVADIENIILASDAVMVARGDLAIESQASEVPIIQQKIIKTARQHHRPVIVATQMLESMIENPRPTRAEVSDVANAVLDQADAVMLSAESANGKYPVEAVKVMADVIRSVEQHPDYKHYIKINWQNIDQEELSYSAIASTAASLAFRINAKMIVVATTTGRIAALVSSFRPDIPIVSVAHTDVVKNQLNLFWGLHPIMISPMERVDEFWQEITKLIQSPDYEAKAGDKVVMVSGSTVGVKGAADTIKVITL